MRAMVADAFLVVSIAAMVVGLMAMTDEERARKIDFLILDWTITVGERRLRIQKHFDEIRAEAMAEQREKEKARIKEARHVFAGHREACEAIDYLDELHNAAIRAQD